MKAIQRSAVVLAGALALVGCGSSADRATDRRAAATVTIGTTVDLAGVNDLISGGVRFSNEVLDQLFLSLLHEQPDWAEHPPTLAPELAASWELGDEGRTLTFHLRPDARWSDGTPVTAEDVRFSWQAQKSPAIAWPYSQSKDPITAVDVIDPRTVRFRFRAGYPFQVIDANDGRILPAHAWSALPFERWRRSEPWFQQHAVFDGPFRIASWSPQQELVLERNPLFGEAPPRSFARVVFRVVPDPAALVERLLAGDLDFYDGLTPLDADRVRSSPRLRLVVSDSRHYDYVGWNARRPPFDDPEVRRALTLAIDRQEIVDTLWRGFARVAAGPIPAGVWARDPDLVPWPYDPQAARELLARRGYTDHDGDGLLDRDGQPLRFELMTNATNRQRCDATLLIRDHLRRIGVDAVPRALELQVLIERLQSGDFDAALAGWGIDTTLDLHPYFHSSEIASGQNFVGYRNAEVDRLLDETRAATDLDTERPLVVQVQRLLHQEQPYTFLWESRRLAAAARDLDGVEVNHLAALGSLARWTRAPTSR